jgi:arylsulfatase A-like enzyme
MNVVFIMCDTLRRDYLGCYGNTWVKTPCLDKFAAEAHVFDRAYFSSYPTVPNRWDILTGRLNCTYAQWQRLDDREITLGQVLGAQKTISMMIADTPHIFKNGFNYSRGFTGWNWIRGQENDQYMTDPADPKLPCDPKKLRSPDFSVKQYLRNVSRRRSEADYFAPMTMAAAGDWLERNYKSRFFLYVDTFDPHEPWDPPKYYTDLYDPGYKGEEVTYPRYAPSNYLTEAEIKHIRALYAGEVTMVDRWVGRVLDTIDRLGLRDNTAVIVTTDHGFLHGEHGLMGKSVIAEEYYESVHMYEEIARIPLMIRLPGQKKGVRHGALVQSIDMMPTILEMEGVIETTAVEGKTSVQLLQCGFYQTQKWNLDLKTLHGKSLMPIMNGDVDKVRDIAMTSCTLIQGTPRIAKCAITNEEWALLYCGESADPAKELKPPAIPCGKNPEDYQVGDTQPALFHLPSDPGEKNNIIKKHADVAKALHAKYVKFLEAVGVAEPHLKLRRRLKI